jgi:hypothetical protein
MLVLELSRKATIRQLTAETCDRIGVAIRGRQAQESGVGFVENAEPGQRDGGGEIRSFRGIERSRQGLRLGVTQDSEARFGRGRPCGVCASTCHISTRPDGSAVSGVQAVVVRIGLSAT